MAKKKKELDQNLSYDVWCKFSEHFLLNFCYICCPGFFFNTIPNFAKSIEQEIVACFEEKGWRGRGRLK
jgi:hypothetical protein